MQLFSLSYFQCFSFFNKDFSIYLFPIAQQVSNDEHFHLRYFCILQLSCGVLFFFCHTKISKTQKKKKNLPLYTTQNTVISPNSLVWKFTQFRAIRSKLCRICAFPQNFQTRKVGKITVFCAVLIYNKMKHIQDTVKYPSCNFLQKELATFNVIMVFGTKSMAHKPSIVSR